MNINSLFCGSHNTAQKRLPAGRRTTLANVHQASMSEPSHFFQLCCCPSHKTQLSNYHLFWAGLVWHQRTAQVTQFPLSLPSLRRYDLFLGCIFLATSLWKEHLSGISNHEKREKESRKVHLTSYFPWCKLAVHRGTGTIKEMLGLSPRLWRILPHRVGAAGLKGCFTANNPSSHPLFHGHQQ